MISPCVLQGFRLAHCREAAITHGGNTLDNHAIQLLEKQVLPHHTVLSLAASRAKGLRALK